MNDSNGTGRVAWWNEKEQVEWDGFKKDSFGDLSLCYELMFPAVRVLHPRVFSAMGCLPVSRHMAAILLNGSSDSTSVLIVPDDVEPRSNSLCCKSNSQPLAVSSLWWISRVHFSGIPFGLKCAHTNQNNGGGEWKMDENEGKKTILHWVQYCTKNPTLCTHSIYTIRLQCALCLSFSIMQLN